MALGAFPCLVFRLDGSVFEVITVDSTVPKEFEAVTEARAGEHLLSIAYVNDRAGGNPPFDRNVWIEKIDLRTAC